MKFTSPVNPYLITQRFGDNASPTYKAAGFNGHTGEDLGGYYGQSIFAACDGEVYSIINKDNPDLGKYRCVFTIIQDEQGKYYELSYGHLSNIKVNKGDVIKTGDYIADMGNTGEVYANGRLVTLEEKKAGSKAGVHLHLQLRPLKLIEQMDGYTLYDYALYNGLECPKREGKYLAYALPYNNGEAACIDPMPFLADNVLTTLIPNKTTLKVILDLLTNFWNR